MLESISYHTGEHKLAPPLAWLVGVRELRVVWGDLLGVALARPPVNRSVSILGWVVVGANPEDAVPRF